MYRRELRGDDGVLCLALLVKCGRSVNPAGSNAGGVRRASAARSERRRMRAAPRFETSSSFSMV